MSINVGDVIYANNMAGDMGRIESHGAGDWDNYYDSMGGDIHLEVYEHWLGATESIKLQKLINGSWTDITGVVSSGFQGRVATDYMCTQGYYHVRSNGSTDSSASSSFSCYRSQTCSRVAGNLIRTINQFFSDYEFAGISIITAALVNAGRVCTY